MNNICVYGSSSNWIDQSYLDGAFELGAEIAKAGFGMVFGGGDTGVMGAAARGAHSAGGHVTGVLPRFMDVPGAPYNECDRMILTETMRERKKIMEDLSLAYVAAPGGIGTLEEFFEMLTLKQLGQHKKPIVLLNTGGYYDPLEEMLKTCVTGNFTEEAVLGMYAAAARPKEAVEHIIGSFR